MDTHRIPDRICVSFGPLVAGELIERVNRFRVHIRVDGQERAAYLANPGRLKELLVPGRRVWVTAAPHLQRKTAYNLTLIEHKDTLISMNSHLPNRLLHAALTVGAVPWFSTTPTVRGEVAFGHSRLDFHLSNHSGDVCWLEAKSCTLVEAGVARFPDAPTLRGRRHLGELVAAVEQGDRAAVVFVVQREDAIAFAPYDETDPAFGDALRAAASAGVEVRALRCTVTTECICLDRSVPVHLGRPQPI
jgi:sugar fermentation stimulation protein A